MWYLEDDVPTAEAAAVGEDGNARVLSYHFARGELPHHLLQLLLQMRHWRTPSCVLRVFTVRVVNITCVMCCMFCVSYVVCYVFEESVCVGKLCV